MDIVPCVVQPLLFHHTGEFENTFTWGGSRAAPRGHHRLTSQALEVQMLLLL